MKETFYVVDFRDDFVLFSGTLNDCEQVVEESYGGLDIVSLESLTQNMINSLQN